MYARTAKGTVGAVAFLAIAAVLGCGDAQTGPPVQQEPSQNGTGEVFDKSTAATISGHVIWKGDRPSVQPLAVRPGLTASGFHDEENERPNPNAPAIGPMGAVEGAVVFLRGIEARRARPWDKPPVCVAQEGRRLHVRQGSADGAVGFVRRGDVVEMLSEDAEFYSLHASGAAFFTLAFPDPGKPRRRQLAKCGVVELSSAAGAFWMRGYLFVDDHPYYTQTDAEGHYTLERVPPGHYEVVCWLPDWREDRHERDPETALVTRVFFRPPLEWVSPVEVTAHTDSIANFAPSVP